MHTQSDRLGQIGGEPVRGSAHELEVGVLGSLRDATLVAAQLRVEHRPLDTSDSVVLLVLSTER